MIHVSSKLIQKARQTAKRNRISVACAACKGTKTKCSEFRPCNRCVKIGRSCPQEYELNQNSSFGNNGWNANNFCLEPSLVPDLGCASSASSQSPLSNISRPIAQYPDHTLRILDAKATVRVRDDDVSQCAEPRSRLTLPPLISTNMRSPISKGLAMSPSAYHVDSWRLPFAESATPFLPPFALLFPGAVLKNRPS